MLHELESQTTPFEGGTISTNSRAGELKPRVVVKKSRIAVLFIGISIVPPSSTDRDTVDRSNNFSKPP